MALGESLIPGCLFECIDLVFFGEVVFGEMLFPCIKIVGQEVVVVKKSWLVA